MCQKTGDSHLETMMNRPGDENMMSDDKITGLGVPLIDGDAVEAQN